MIKINVFCKISVILLVNHHYMLKSIAVPNSGVNRAPLFLSKPARILLGFHTPDSKKLASKVTKSKLKTEVEEEVQNDNVELKSF